MVTTKVVRALAVGLTGLLGLLGALFIAGEGLTDPGGWKGIALLASWGIPMLVLVLLALRRPGTASRLLPWTLAAAGLVGIALPAAACSTGSVRSPRSPCSWWRFRAGSSGCTGPAKRVCSCSLLPPCSWWRRSRGT